MFRSRPKKRCSRPRGMTPARLPPGQYLTEKWPVLHAGLRAPAIRTSTRLDAARLRPGRERGRAHMGAAQRVAAHRQRAGHPLRDALDAASTPRFEGVHWRELAKLAVPKPTAQLRGRLGRARLHLERPARASLEDDLALLATHADGEPLTPDHGYPAAARDPRTSTSGRAPSGSAASSCRPTTASASGSATATTTTPTPGKRSDTASELSGKVALVAGATRGAGRAIAVELARAGAFVYATGRSSRTSGRSDQDRPRRSRRPAS